MILYGAIVGYLLFDMFSADKTKNKMIESRKDADNNKKNSDI